MTAQHSAPSGPESSLASNWRAALIPFAAAALAALLVACGQVTYSAEEHIERGVAFLDAGDVAAASIEFRNALQQDPASAEGRFRLGMLLLEAGDARGAEAELRRAEDFRWDSDQLRLPLLRTALLQERYGRVMDETRLIESFPEAQVPEALALRGTALLRMGNPSGAEAMFMEALSYDSGSMASMLGMARVSMVEERNEARARDWVARALAAQPNNVEALELLGDIESNAGRLQEAEAAYSEAVRASRRPFEPLVKRAIVRTGLGDFAGAERDAASLHRITRGHPSVHYVRGLIAFDQGRFADAQVEFESVLAANSRHVPARFYLGASHFAQGHWRQAESHLSRFVSSDPQNAEASALLAVARLQEGDAARAENTLRTLLSNRPDDVRTLSLMGDVYLRQGRTADAVQQMRHVATLDPHSAQARARLGLALLSEGQREEGLGELEAAVSLAPDDFNDLESNVILERLRGGEYQRALELAQRLRDRHPDQALPHNLVGLAYLGLERVDEATVAFRAALERSPGFAAASQNLALLALRRGDVGAALQIMKEAVAANESNSGLWLILAEIHMRQGDRAAAGAALEGAVNAEPRALEPRLAQARYHLQGNEPRQAVAALRAVREEHGDSVEWLRQLAVAQSAAGDAPSETETLARLGELEALSPDQLFSLSQRHAHAEDVLATRIALERALALDPQHFGARLALTRLYMGEGRTEEARELLTSLRASDPEDPRVLMQSGWMSIQEGRHAQAIPDLRKASEKAPDDPVILASLVEAQWQGGEQSAAAVTMEHWLERHPEDHDTRLRLAMAYLTLGDETRAKHEFSDLVRQFPENVLVLNNLAWLLREEDPRLALQYAQRAADVAPDVPSVLDTLGVVQMAAGDPRAAVETLRKAASMAPDDPSIALHLAEVLVRTGEVAEAKSLLVRLLAEHADFAGRKAAEKLLADLD